MWFNNLMKDRHHIAISPHFFKFILVLYYITITIEIHLQKYGLERIHNIINANMQYQHIIITYTYAAYLPCTKEIFFFFKLGASSCFELNI